MRERLQVGLLLLFMATIAWLLCAWGLPASIWHRIGSGVLAVILVVGLFFLNHWETSGKEANGDDRAGSGM